MTCQVASWTPSLSLSPFSSSLPDSPFTSTFRDRAPVNLCCHLYLVPPEPFSLSLSTTLYPSGNSDLSLSLQDHSRSRSHYSGYYLSTCASSMGTEHAEMVVDGFPTTQSSSLAVVGRSWEGCDSTV